VLSPVCFSELPLEILYQILMHVMPIELMRLSRVSKGLRCILLNPSSAYIWDTAVEKLPNFPVAPKMLGMNVPQVVYMAFEDQCDACGSPFSDESLLRKFHFKLNICVNCTAKRFRSVPSEGWGSELDNIVPMLAQSWSRKRRL
jgi:hypothetical protein